MTFKRIYRIIPLLTLLIVSCQKQNNGISNITSSTNSSSSSEYEPIETTGITQVKDLSFLSRDLKDAYAPALGDVKLMVVPISFVGSTKNGYESQIQEWTNQKIEDVNQYYFTGSKSLAKYYRTASFDKLRITGEVSDIYQNSEISIKSILEDDSMETLRDLMDNALNYLHDHASGIDWKSYDLNQDGCIDNIHFITDYCSNTWAENLWPHMFWTNRKGTIERPMVNVYSMSGTYYVQDSITAIHEQGHIFGLQDYYDYSNNGNSPINYVGRVDMQSNNRFDWNSYSKLTTGWVDPYVVDGSKDVATITLKAASLNGDCLIIPADYSKWNGSAFDEYFLIELFAPFGNNEEDWQTFKSVLGNKPGVRMYHVDSRAFGSNKTDPDNNELLIIDNMEEQQLNSREDCSKYKYNTVGANNSSDWRDYEGGIAQLADHPLLTLIQREKEFSFGDSNIKARHLLNNTDLFTTGDKFSFDDYSHFLNKSRNKQSTMDNREIFPYEISFGKLTDDSIEITVTKVK